MVRIGPVYGIIFDLTGTLATVIGLREDWQAARHAGVRAVHGYLNESGITIAPEEFARRVRETTEAETARQGGNRLAVSARKILTDTVASFGRTLTEEQRDAAEAAYYAPQVAGWQILPGALEAVETLNAEGFRLALASNMPSHHYLEEIVAHIGLRPFFSPVMSSALAGGRKPDPRLFQVIAEAWELDPATVVVIGDGLQADVEGAHAAGMRAVLVRGEANPENADYRGAAQPDASLAHISEAPALIEVWQAAAGDDQRPETGFVEDF